MDLRRLLPHDIPIIDWIWQKFHKGKFGIPSLKNVIADRVVTDDGKIVAYGMLKGYCEAILILDHHLSTRDRLEAIKLLAESAEKSAVLAGIEQLQIFVQDDNFKDILIKHFDFKPCIGTPLYKDLTKKDLEG